jgi:DNA repair exonuclease SbcCD ATPase subunit
MLTKTVKKTPITAEEVAAILTNSIAEMSRKMAESSAAMDAKIALSRAETDAKIAASDAKMALSRAETDRAIQRLTDRIESLSKSTSEELMAVGAYVKEVSEKVKEISENLGNVGNRLGELTELIVVPQIRLCMNACGHDFKRLTANKIFTKTIINRQKQKLKQTLAEVDAFLSNGVEAMAVEIKTNLTVAHVDSYINKLQRLRANAHEKNVNLHGKKLYGALVGLYIEPQAYDKALKNGIYVLEIIEDKNRLKVHKPVRCRSW